MEISVRKGLSLSQLEAFMHVAQMLSFRAAAKALNVSQPALTRTIKLAEERLQTQLFDRDKRNIELTPSGKKLLPIARRILSQFNESFSELSEFLTGSGGRLTIAALPFFAVGTLPGAIAAFTRNRKGVSFVLKQSNAVPLLDELVEGSIDFAVTARPVMSSQFQFQPMITDDYVLLCRHDDVLAEAEPELGPVPWSAFEGRQFIAAASSSSVRAATDQIFQQQGITVDAAFEVANWAMVPRLVGEGLGVAALPRMVATMGDCSKLRMRNLTPAVHRSVGIVTLRKRTLSPLASSFIDHLLTYWGPGRCP